MIDCCYKGGFWNMQTTDSCPTCGAMMDLCIAGLSLSWKCRKCDYGVATTVNKLCFWNNNNNNFSKECYSKIKTCPYREK